RPVASPARPGPWLRLTALTAAGACCAAVVSGALELGAAHRFLAAIALPPLAALVAAGWVAHRRLLAPALVALLAFLAAALVISRPAHLALAGVSLASALVLVVQTFRGEPVEHTRWRDYVTLTKPRIMSLLLLTGAAGMFVGAQGVPPLGTFAVTMAGLALACGGASALNHVLDRDLDRLMRRTGHRPVAEERVTPDRALEFGLALMAFSFVLLASLVNVLTAALALVGGLFYVLVYTRWLKRSTPQNIVIGGAAGAVPPLVGWAAATGNLTLPALFLFLIVFFWTPPHFWALALIIKRDYAAARVPMLPVVRGDDETARQIVWYSLVLVAVTLLPFAWHTAGVVYLVAALLLGALFLRLAWRLRRETTTARAGALFHYSLLYLALIFVALAVDPLL
ncbi:MAG TPA: heme o synthase, partial [Gaiellaceae bacterium]|nr:heme o synthase [Gaiellaceae bacterium]